VCIEFHEEIFRPSVFKEEEELPQHREKLIQQSNTLIHPSDSFVVVIINVIKNVASSLKLFGSLTKGSFDASLKSDNGTFIVTFCSCGMSRQQLSIAQPIRLSCYHIGDAILLKMQKLPDVSKSLCSMFFIIP